MNFFPDTRAARTVRETITDLAAGDTTVFLSTHILPVIEELATEIGIIYNGELVTEDSLDTLVALYIDELSTILHRGIVSEYRRTGASEESVKDHIDIQRQLQRHGLVGTQFECTYDDLTADTTVNQSILYAAVILKRLVSDTALQRTLERYEIRFRQTVSLRQVSTHQFATGELRATVIDQYHQR